jgi:hypothetical protein
MVSNGQGTIDLIVFTNTPGALFQPDVPGIVLLYNNFYNDAFSLKSLGTCPSSLTFSIERRLSFLVSRYLTQPKTIRRKLRWRDHQIHRPRYIRPRQTTNNRTTTSILIPLPGHPIHSIRPRSNKQLHRFAICRRD